MGSHMASAYAFWRVLVAEAVLYLLPAWLEFTHTVSRSYLVHLFSIRGWKFFYFCPGLNQTHNLRTFLNFPKIQFFDQQNGGKWINPHVPPCNSSAPISAPFRVRAVGLITVHKALQAEIAQFKTVMNWEIGIDMYTVMCIKLMTNKNLLYKK